MANNFNGFFDPEVAGTFRRPARGTDGGRDLWSDRHSD
jgi:hypothetical protein